MQEKDLDLKSLDDKLPASLRGLIYMEPYKPTPKGELEEWRKKYAEFLENNKKNKD